MIRGSRADLDALHAKGRINTADYRAAINAEKNKNLAFPKPISTPKAKRTSSPGRMRVRKGKAAERELAHIVESHTGERTYRTPMSGGFREIGAADLMGDPFRAGHILADQSWECKSANQVKFQAWWRQASEQAASEGKRPVLAIRATGGEWTVTVGMEHWLSLHPPRAATRCPMCEEDISGLGEHGLHACHGRRPL